MRNIFDFCSTAVYFCRQSGNPFLNIERETAILRKINHPNVVKLFEIMDDPEEDMMYFVFEFMDRGCILSIPTGKSVSVSAVDRYCGEFRGMFVYVIWLPKVQHLKTY